MPAQSTARLDITRTGVLHPLRAGRREELDELVVLLYDELREIAHPPRVARDDASTLATTALVHEAYLELVDARDARWNDRAHFLSFRGLTHDEIAAALGVTVRTVRAVECDRGKAPMLLRELLAS